VARRKQPTPAHEVDLHGRGVESALRHLTQELAYCRSRGLSPVLVLTGRGWHSPGQESVLTPAVQTWLRGRAARALGVGDCQLTHGGGAILVRLNLPERGFSHGNG
jgi:DNA-nicking Smr family endonuclease